MSRVLLIAADRPLPLCDRREQRSAVSRFGEEEYRVSCLSGFCVSEHAYYRPAVDALCLAMRPFQYELSLEEQETDLKALLDYLRKHFTCGESVELWHLWLGEEQDNKPVCYTGALADFDMDTLKQFLDRIPERGDIGPCRRMTITV